jgi:hypothetical protein
MSLSTRCWTMVAKAASRSLSVMAVSTRRRPHRHDSPLCQYLSQALPYRGRPYIGGGDQTLFSLPFWLSIRSDSGVIGVVPKKRKGPIKRRGHPAALLSVKPAYATHLGAAYAGNALHLLKLLPSRSVNAIITSPPYALHFKKSYGNPRPAEYVEWFMPFAHEFRRVLRPTGSLVVEIGGAWNRGEPTRSIYHFELLVELVNKAGFHLAEEFFWFNRARMPGPAEWVNVQRIRVKDAVENVGRRFYLG